MQLGSKETENERFAHYLTKTYRKTASLIANCLKAVNLLFFILFIFISNIYIYMYEKSLCISFVGRSVKFADN